VANTVTVLFTGAGRRVELLRAFTAAHAALGLQGGIIAADVDILAPALHVAHAYELVPPSADPGYVDALLRICRDRRVDLVFPVIDNDIPILAQAAPRFAEAGVRVATMGPASAHTVADKWATARLLHDAGIEGPRTWLPSELPSLESLPLPLYIKPRHGSGSKHTARVDSADELDVFMRRVPEPVIQELLEGPEVTCDLAYSLEGEFLGLCQRRRIETRSGEVQKGVTIWDPEIAEGCLAIGKALAASGPITIQCFVHDGRPCFTEINGRFGGGLPLAIAAGLDFPRWYLALAAGLPVEFPEPGDYRKGLYLTRCDESFFCTGLTDEPGGADAPPAAGSADYPDGQGPGGEGRSQVRVTGRLVVERGPWLSQP
jgi:carbamoyl-phosphate synthase large subunit